MMKLKGSIKLETIGQFKLKFENLMIKPLTEMENSRMLDCELS